MAMVVRGRVVGGVVVPQGRALPEGVEATILVPEGPLACGSDHGDLWAEIAETRRLARELLDQARTGQNGTAPNPKNKPKA